MSIQNENDVSIIDSTKEDSINNLFGLTSEVETEIKFCIENNHKKRLLFLFDLPIENGFQPGNTGRLRRPSI